MNTAHDLRRWIELCEAKRSIDIKNEDGYANGDIISTDDVQLRYWLEENNAYLRSVVREISAFRVIAILDFFNVKQAMRGQQIGSRLFADFKEKAIQGGAEAILLVSAADDDNFDLIAWYQRLGFAALTNNGVMLLRLSGAASPATDL